ncbi:hypothetical protein DERP_008313 [Dermatophagoides pteronyssinus]|uniref:Uncharacterized protein n=1 Tax=Dermatophagoides pteronyssinus TaxID=6956 RepID=A0ABQ8J672_DERPT|nr:hypothetical protein DERP_008313 [Dermatophagoides pteronyssinus]
MNHHHHIIIIQTKKKQKEKKSYSTIDLLSADNITIPVNNDDKIRYLIQFDWKKVEEVEKGKLEIWTTSNIGFNQRYFQWAKNRKRKDFDIPVFSETSFSPPKKKRTNILKR